MNDTTQNIIDHLSNGFIASCQPTDDGPMDSPDIVAAMAKAAIIGGAVGLRIEGIDNLKAVRPHIKEPIIGIVKRDLDGTDIRITPFIEDVIALKEAGADIIAIDGTNRIRPVEITALVETIHQLGCIAMADCSSFDEGKYCQSLGVEIIGTTLSGYTGGDVPAMPDLALVARLQQSDCLVMAEGRYNSPELAKQAIEAGAFCVTVGSAITRIEHICDWFHQAVKAGHMSRQKA